MIFIPPILYTQYAAGDVKDIISTNDATIQGILLGVIIALSTALIYIYKEKNSERVRLLEENNKLREEYVNTLKTFNAELIRINNTTTEAINFLRTR